MTHRVFIGRQKIYNENMKIIAYELLYRDSYKNSCRFENTENLTFILLNNLEKIGVKKVINNKKIFINCTHTDLKLILDSNIFINKNIIIEILESVKITKELIFTLNKLKNKGYLIALDDVNNTKIINRFGKNIDIYKIDFLSTNPNQRKQLIKKIKQINVNSKILAEKISNYCELKEALNLKFDYFQGFFLDIPEIITN